MLNSRTLKLLAPLTVAAALLAGCGSSKSGSSASTSGGGNAASGTPSFALRIGNILPFTGDLSTFGPSFDAATRLAASYINSTLASEGLGSHVSVKIVDSEDDQSKIQPALEAAQKLVQIDHVNVIVGTISSGSTIAVAQSVAIPNNVVEITPTSSATAISSLKDNNLVFRILPSDAFQARELVRAVSDKLGPHATVNVGARNDDFGTALQSQFEQLWKQGGGTVGRVVKWNPDAPTFDTEAQTLAGGHPSGWVIIDFPPTFAKVGAALVRAGGWSPSRTFMTAEMRTPDAFKLVGAPVMNGLNGVAPSTAKTTLLTSFDTFFKQKEPGKPLTGFEGLPFDAVMVAFLAALDAHSSDPGKFKDQIQKVTNPPGTQDTYLQLGSAIKDILAGKKVKYEGVSGSLNLDANGDPTAARFELWTAHGQGFKTLHTYSLTGATQ